MGKRGIKPGQKWSEARRSAHEAKRSKTGVSANPEPIVAPLKEGIEA